jgi:exonuclease SbcD
VFAEGEQAGEDYLRVELAEPARAGLGDLVREKLPNALEVQLDAAHRPRPGGQVQDRPSRIGRSPLELFGDYLATRGVDDPRVTAMFAQLLDEATSDDSADDSADDSVDDSALGVAIGGGA